MKEEIKNQCYLLSLEGYSGIEIAEKLNMSRGTVSKAIHSITKGNDYQLAVKGCGVLLQEYTRFQDYCKKKLKELDELSEQKKMMFKNNNKSGQIEGIETELSPIDKVSIIRLQTEIYKDLLTIGAAGDFIQNVRIMRDKLSELEARPDIKQG